MQPKEGDVPVEQQAVETPSTPQEPVSSGEVKPEPNKGVEDVTRLRQQVENLNVALKQEREEGKKKIQELSQKLEDTSSVYDRMRQAFNPEEPKENEPSFATKEELEAVVASKLEEYKEEQKRNKQIMSIKKEIKTLEKEWNGTEGKPKYDDTEVLEWQRRNDKTYLSPKEAFSQMKQQEIIDYQVKKRLSSANPVHDVETPSSTPSYHQPTEIKQDNINLDTRKAIMEAMEQASQEM